jgi:hypothetical protein
MVGGYFLCVRGAASKHWYCRDAGGSFFSGSLASGFEQLRDTRGRAISEPIRAVMPVPGSGIEALGDAGALYSFVESSVRQPLRFKRTTIDKRVVGLEAPAMDRLYDDSIVTHERALGQFGTGRVRTIAGPVRAAYQFCWADGAGVLSCIDHGETLHLAEHVTALTEESALTESNSVIAIDRPAGKPPTVRPVAGVPSIIAIAGNCGLSRDLEVWCWGRESETDAPALRLEPRPIRL